jgi:hypothetical protein
LAAAAWRTRSARDWGSRDRCGRRKLHCQREGGLQKVLRKGKLCNLKGVDAGLNLPGARPANSKTRIPDNGGGPVIVVVRGAVYKSIGRNGERFPPPEEWFHHVFIKHVCDVDLKRRWSRLNRGQVRQQGSECPVT